MYNHVQFGSVSFWLEISFFFFLFPSPFSNVFVKINTTKLYIKVPLKDARTFWLSTNLLCDSMTFERMLPKRFCCTYAIEVSHARWMSDFQHLMRWLSYDRFAVCLSFRIKPSISFIPFCNREFALWTWSIFCSLACHQIGHCWPEFLAAYSRDLIYSWKCAALAFGLLCISVNYVTT